MPELHRWDLQPAEAKALQLELAERVKLQSLPVVFKVLGAADIAYVAATNQLVAVMVTFQWPDLTLMESSHVVAPVAFPYIPGLLSFREVPPLLAAHRKLRRPPRCSSAMVRESLTREGAVSPRTWGCASTSPRWAVRRNSFAASTTSLIGVGAVRRLCVFGMKWSAGCFVPEMASNPSTSHPDT